MHDSGGNARTEPPPPSCPDSFRASMSFRRLAPSRLAPRCRKTWMPGTSPGMTAGREGRTVGPRSVSRSGACRRHRHRVGKSLPGRHSRPADAGRECRHMPTPPAGRHCRRQMPTVRARHRETTYARFRRHLPPLPSPLPLAGGAGGGCGTEKGRRHLLRRPHFPTVRNMVSNASPVKRKTFFFLPSDSPPAQRSRISLSMPMSVAWASSSMSRNGSWCRAMKSSRPPMRSA